MTEIKVQSIKINDENYLLEKDVDKFYTRKDKVEVDRLVLGNALLNLRPEDFVLLVTSVAEEKLTKIGYAGIDDMRDPNREEYTMNKLLMIINAGRI